MNLQKLIDAGLISKFKVEAYDLGKHWPETGDYQSWIHKKLVDFQTRYVYLSHETFSTNSGGTWLLAKGVPKKMIEDLEKGIIACPHCYFKGKADDVATHRVDKHFEDYEKIRLWLRGIIEEGAFHDPA